jgi:hypothetical protein
MTKQNKHLPISDNQLVKHLEVLKSIHASEELHQRVKSTLVRALPLGVHSAGKALVWNPVAVLACLLAFFIFTGTSLVSAAENSLPGSWLYPIKRVTEEIELTVTRDPVERINLREERINRRLNELQTALQTTPGVEPAQIEQASEDYENEITENTEQIEEETQDIDMAEEHYRETLDHHSEELGYQREIASEEVKPLIDNLILITQAQASTPQQPTPVLIDTPAVTITDILPVELISPTPVEEYENISDTTPTPNPVITGEVQGQIDATITIPLPTIKLQLPL